METMVLIIAALCANLHTDKAFEQCKSSFESCKEIETVTYDKHGVIAFTCLRGDDTKIRARLE